MSRRRTREHMAPQGTGRSAATRFLLGPAAGLGFAMAVGLAASASHASPVTVQDPGLEPYTIVDFGIPEPLTSQPGDPVEGKKVFVGRRLGNCLACHTAPIPEEDFHGEVGPDLTGIGSRASEAELRLRIVDPKRINPETNMVSYYKTSGLTQVLKAFEGKPVLTAQQVEDLVAYLKTLQ